MGKKVMTSIKLPESIEKKMLQTIINDGYGMRGKSKWVTEAIEEFLMIPNFYELVDIATSMEQLSRVATLRLSEELAKKLDNALISVRKFYPNLEGVRSNIIRASIMQRLIRK
jgi:predicted DNA-binding protein